MTATAHEVSFAGCFKNVGRPGRGGAQMLQAKPDSPRADKFPPSLNASGCCWNDRDDSLCVFAQSGPIIPAQPGKSAQNICAISS